MNQKVASNMQGPTVKRTTSVSTVLYQRGYVPMGSKVPGHKNRHYSEPNPTWRRSMRRVSQQRFHSIGSTHKSTNQLAVGTTAASNSQPGYTSGKTGAQKDKPFVPISISKTSQKLVQSDTQPVRKIKGASW